MDNYRRYRFRSLVNNLIFYLTPLGVGVAAWWILINFSNATDQTVLIVSIAIVAFGLLIAASWKHFTTAKAMQLIHKHLTNISQNNFDYRSHTKPSGQLGDMIILLNRLSDTLQQFSTRSQSETSVIAAEANRLRNIINSINDGVLALDKSGRIILFNKAAAKITGYSMDEAAGQPISYIAPFLRGNSLVLNDWLQTCEGADIQSQVWQNIKLKTKEGKVRSVDIQALYQGADPNGVRTLLTFQDRTEAQELEDMKVDFVALAAHELRTPISVIRGYIEILENELGELSPEHKEFMRKLSVSASQLSGFINNILHVSRIEHGNLNLKREPLSWSDVVNSITAELSQKAQLQGKKLVINLPENLPKVAVDRLSIVEVLNNLVDNAIKYSERGHTVTLTVKKDAESIETTVTDEGVGIPENAIDKLFTKFYRSHRTRSSHRGTGLGLYMSKAIVDAHGGKIWVRSKIGEGSTFGFSLPIYNKNNQRNLSIATNSKIIRGVHGWIKNHSLYRG